MTNDITEHEQIEKASQTEWNRLKSILDLMNDGVYIVNQQYDIKYINPVIEREFGLVGGRKCYEYFHNLTEVCPWCKNIEVFSGKSVRWEWFSVKTGKTYDLFDAPIKNADGSISKIEFFHDVTEHKKAQDEIEQLKLQNELILNSAGEGIYGVDLEGKTIFANPAATEMIGWKVEELIGKYQHNLIHHTKPDGTPYPQEECPIYTTFRDGKVYRVEDEVFWRKDGTGFPVRYTSAPIRDRHGKLIGTVVIFEDITEQKQAEEEIKKRVKELEKFYEMAVGRELKMKELKEKIKKLEAELSKYRKDLE